MPPDIYSYTDYRKFLRDWFEWRAGRPSIRGFASKVGASPAQLSSVLAGTRDLSGPLAEAVADALGLDAAARAYFLDLVEYEQAETRANRREALARLMNTRRFRQSRLVEDTHYQLFAQWYYAAIVELARCRGFRSDPDWIAATLVPAVSREDVADALDLLTTAGYLVRNAEGQLVPGHPSYATTHDVGRLTGLALASLHRWLLARGRDALEEFPPDERYFGTLCCAVPEEEFEEFKRFVTRFHEEAIGRYSEKSDPSRVYQLSIQLFPLTRPPTGS